MNVSVFCSASDEIDEDFFKAAEALGKYLAGKGHTVVCGGSDAGLMERLARTVRTAKGRVMGIVPSVLEDNGHVSDNIDIYMPCNDLSDRKEIMMMVSGAFIALPGGIGTLDEVLSVAASAAIGYHSKPLILYNVKGVWNGLTAMLDELKEKGLVRGDWRRVLNVVDSIDGINGILDRYE